MTDPIHDFCNRWCARCPFVDRCDEAAVPDAPPPNFPVVDRLPYDVVLEEPLAVKADMDRFFLGEWLAVHWESARRRRPTSPLRRAVEQVAFNRGPAYRRLAEAFFADDVEDRHRMKGCAKTARLAYLDVLEGLEIVARYRGADSMTLDLVRALRCMPIEIDGRFGGTRRFRRPGLDA